MQPVKRVLLFLLLSLLFSLSTHRTRHRDLSHLTINNNSAQPTWEHDSAAVTKASNFLSAPRQSAGLVAVFSCLSFLVSPSLSSVSLSLSYRSTTVFALLSDRFSCFSLLWALMTLPSYRKDMSLAHLLSCCSTRLYSMSSHVEHATMATVVSRATQSKRPKRRKSKKEKRKRRRKKYRSASS